MHDHADIVIEFVPGAVRVTSIANGVVHQVFPFVPGHEDAAVQAFREFLQGMAGSTAAVLFPRSLCVTGFFHLPSRDWSELFGMAGLQFSRSTPHGRSDLLLGMRALESPSESHSLVSAVMMTKDVVGEYLDVFRGTRVSIELVTMNTEKLLPLSRRLWGEGGPGESDVIVFLVGREIMMGMYSQGGLFYASAGGAGQDIATDIRSFQEECLNEFPGMAIRHVVLLAEGTTPEMKRIVDQGWIGFVPLSSLAETCQEREALAFSAHAFVDLLFMSVEAGDVLDLSSDEVREGRRRRNKVDFCGHVSVMLSIIFLGGVLILGAGYYQTAMDIFSLRSAIRSDAKKVTLLEQKIRVVTSARKSLLETRPVSSLLKELALALPEGIVLRRVDLEKDRLDLQAEGDSVKAVEAFQKALCGVSSFSNIRLEGIDKRPSEAGGRVMFRIVARVG